MRAPTVLHILRRALDGIEPRVIAEQMRLGQEVVYGVLDEAGYPDPDDVRAWREIFKRGPVRAVGHSTGEEEAA
jgi:hypothetical protein